MNKKAILYVWRLAVGLVAVIALVGCNGGLAPPLQPPQAPPLQAPPLQAAVPSLQPPPLQAAVPAAAETASPVASSPAAQAVPPAPQGTVAAPAAQPPTPTAVDASAPQLTVAVPAVVPEAVPATVPATVPESMSAFEQAKSAVQISITGDKEKGSILETTMIDFKDGESVFDVLQRITKQKKIQMEHRGSAKTPYVEGIDNLYEFDKGGKSGWLYRVNGTFPNKSAGAYVLKKGDRIEWVYTLEMGRDVGKSDNPKVDANQDSGAGSKKP